MKIKINRIIALLSIAVLCFGFTACTSTADSGDTTTTTTTAVAEVSADSVEITESASSTASGASTSAVVKNGTTAKAGASTTVVVKNGTTAKTSTTTKTTSTTTTKRTTATTKKTTTTTTASSKQYCYLTIECSKILDNMDNLKSGHEKYVPSDGYIIKNYKFAITGKETVYDVLKEACNDNGIKLTTNNSSIYGIYVSGINNLDEKDCGQYSGWLYRVNGIAPAKSCGLYTVSNGDRITWSYTC